jgi:hypothetical protein
MKLRIPYFLLSLLRSGRAGESVSKKVFLRLNGQ